MCVILHKTNHVKEQDIADAYEYNSDGFGVMYRENGKVVVDKGLYTLETILHKLWYLRDIEYVAHFRITTRGKTNHQNCHPFQVSDNVWMMHNGTLNINIDNPNMSDTWHFSQLLQSTKITQRLLDYIPALTGTDRMIFMGRKNIHKIGQWEYYNRNEWSNLNWQFSSFYRDEELDDRSYLDWVEQYGSYWATEQDQYNGYYN